MEVAMVKHSENSKIYWFGVPKQLEGELHSGDRVVCDTAKGAQSGVIISAGMRDQDVADVMKASGATYPLRMIVDVTKDIPLKKIVIPEEFKRTLPRDWKLAKRFLEYYHTGSFHTNVLVDEKGVLRDGYTAYLAAKTLHLPYLTASVGSGKKAEAS